MRKHVFKGFLTLQDRHFWYCTLTLWPRSILCDDTILLDHYAVCTSTRQLVWQEIPSRRHIQNLLPYGWPHLERLQCFNKMLQCEKYAAQYF